MITNLNFFFKSFSLVPKLPRDSMPAQLQCSCSGAWGPGNEANNCLLLVSPDLVTVQGNYLADKRIRSKP